MPYNGVTLNQFAFKFEFQWKNCLWNGPQVCFNPMVLMATWLRPEITSGSSHDDVIKWKHFLHYWPFVRGIHRSPVNSPHKGQWRESLMFTLICARINCWGNNREAGDLRRHCAHYDVMVMSQRVSNAQNAFISRHHHDSRKCSSISPLQDICLLDAGKLS